MIDLQQARALLPMPQLMAKLGLGEHAKPTALCIFHEDKNPSAGICEQDGRWHYVCHAGCGSFDEVDLLAKLRSLTKGEAIKQYAELAGVNGTDARTISLIKEATEIFGDIAIMGGAKNAFVQRAEIAALDDEQIAKLAKWRGYSTEFVRKLSDDGLIGTYASGDDKPHIAFPTLTGVHYRKQDGTWRYSPGGKAELFFLGQIEEGAHVHCFESQWDALAYADASGELTNVVATRGASNAKLAAQRLTGHTGTIYLWSQNDEPGQKWALDIRELLPNEQIKMAVTPPEHKDLNAWKKAGATDGAIWQAFLDAKDYLCPTNQPLKNTDENGVRKTWNDAENTRANGPLNTLSEVGIDQRLGENTSNKEGQKSAVATAESDIPLASISTTLGTSINQSQEWPPAAETESKKKSPSALSYAPIATEKNTTATEPVNGQTIANLEDALNAIHAFLKRYMRMEEEWQPDLCSLWAAYTWAFKSFARTPYLYIFSPEANCGKTQLMNCLYYLSPPEPRRWSIVAPSEASLFRKIHKDTPVIFVDEIDIYFAKGYDDPIVGILNAGYKIGSRVPRCIGRSGELEEFEVFCPKCFTGIGKLPSTTASRSIHIRLTRQASDDMAQSFRELDIPREVQAITSFLADWAKTNSKTLQAARPEIPAEIKDGRKIEIIEPLLAIADLAGETWGERARYAAVCAFDQNLEAQSEKIQLLASIRSILLTKNIERIPTVELLSKLVDLEDADAPWALKWEKDLAQNRSRGPAMKLARMLQAFGIHPRNYRADDDEVSRGYLRADFELAWKRYLPSEVKLQPMELGL